MIANEVIAEQSQSDITVCLDQQVADRILEQQHTLMRKQMLRFDELLTKVQETHGTRHGDILGHLRCVFDFLRMEIEKYLMPEEAIYFPVVNTRMMEHEHDSAGQAFDKMRQITGNYHLPDDASRSFKALYDGLQAMDADLREHIHMEHYSLSSRSGKRLR